MTLDGTQKYYLNESYLDNNYMTYEFYKTHEQHLQKDACAKFPEIFEVFIDNDLGWFPIWDKDNYLVKAIKEHNPELVFLDIKHNYSPLS